MKRVGRILLYTAIIFAAMMLARWTTNAFADTATLSWNATTENCDLSVAEDVAGYVILWGTQNGGPYPNEHIVTTPSTTTTVDVGNQDGTTLYFVGVTYDINGNRSDDPGGCGYSLETSVNFPVGIPAAMTGLAGVAGP